MSILLQQEKVVSPREMDRYWEEKAEREAQEERCRQSSLWRLVRWIIRQP